VKNWTKENEKKEVGIRKEKKEDFREID